MGASAIETLGLVPARNVTLGFLVMYACFFTLQAGTKFYLLARAKRLAKQRGDKSPSFAQIKYGGSQHHGGSRLGLTFDRAVGNTIDTGSRVSSPSSDCISKRSWRGEASRCGMVGMGVDRVSCYISALLSSRTAPCCSSQPYPDTRFVCVYSHTLCR